MPECLPKDVQEALTKAKVDPSRKPGEKDAFPLMNAEMGEVLMRAPAPGVLRLNRKRFREAVREGVDVLVGRVFEKMTSAEETLLRSVAC